MTCPNCKATNFIRDNNSWYCSKCNRHLTWRELKQFYKQHPELKFNRKEYRKKYYHRFCKNHKSGLSVTQIAIIKKCSYRTVYRARHLFDAVPNSKPIRFVFNDKIKNWMSK